MLSEFTLSLAYHGTAFLASEEVSRLVDRSAACDDMKRGTGGGDKTLDQT